LIFGDELTSQYQDRIQKDTSQQITSDAESSILLKGEN
jgi:hypothetical protein